MFGLIIDKVAKAMLKLTEAFVNTVIIPPVNSILNFEVVGVRPLSQYRVKDLCIPYKDKECPLKSASDLAALLACSFEQPNLWERCYYERVSLHFEHQPEPCKIYFYTTFPVR